MADVSFKLTDNTELVKQATAAAVERGLEVVGIEVEGRAKLICTTRYGENSPIDTGRLRNSITHATKTNPGQDAYQDNQGHQYAGGAAKGTPEEKTVYVGTNVEYAPYVEMGTVKMAARPILRPAATENPEQLKKLFEAELRKG